MNQFNWSPGIGDPTVMGWLTVVLYLVAAYSCWRVSVAIGRPQRPQTNEIKVWLSIAALFFALGINKQLDLQSALTEIGRVVAHAYGWYENRRLVQLIFVVLVAAVCLAIALTLSKWMRNGPIPTWLAVFGATLLLGFIVVRAASFHHFDQFINATLLGLRWNWIMEMGGISVVLIACRLRREMCTTRDKHRSH